MTTMRRLNAAIVLVLAMVSFGSCDDSAGPNSIPQHSNRVLQVRQDGTGDSRSIQGAINMAAKGDTILVGAGTYEDSVSAGGYSVVAYITKNLVLLSESGAETTILQGKDVGIYLESLDSTTVVEGFTIRTRFAGYGCFLLETVNTLAKGIVSWHAAARISDNVIEDNDWGIHSVGARGRIQGNTIRRCFVGIRCDDNASTQIMGNVLNDCGTHILVVSASPIIHDNTLSQGCRGVSLVGSRADIRRNFLTAMAGFAVESDASSCQFIGNDLSGCAGGVRLRSTSLGDSVVISYNVFHDLGDVAIGLSDNLGGTIDITNNTIDSVGRGYAIFCQRGSNPHIARNIVTNSFGGIACISLSTPSIVCNNLFAVGDAPYGGECGDWTGQSGNISMDPLFCGGDGVARYAISVASPCAPGNHPGGFDCGVIGARSVGCAVAPTARAEAR